MIAPSGWLSTLPLHAAWYPAADGQRIYLGQRFALSYTPSLRYLARPARAPQGRKSLLAVADPRGDLPHAREEVIAIANLFHDSVTLPGAAATRESVLADLGRHTHVHFACHGLFGLFELGGGQPRSLSLVGRTGPGPPRTSIKLEEHNGRMSDDAAMLEKAITVACRAHYGQRYPSPEREPYIQHPLRVMLAVHPFRTQMVAVLHDVLEETAVTASDLRDAGLPDEVIAAVVAMTHRPENTYEEYIEQVAADPVARQVKLADLADNLANNRRLARTPDVVDRIDRYERAIRALRT